MKKLIPAICTLFFLCLSSSAQNKPYGVFESKTLFQIGMLEDSAGNNMKSVLRFAPFANYTIQLHYDLSNSVGLYTGAGIKNVGFITRYNSIGVTQKSRAYCISIPVGVKFGNMKKERYGYVAGEFLYQFDYKEKVFQGSNKDKRKNFYDSDINAVNWSVMAGFNMKGFTLGAEYTLANFFADNYRFQPNTSSPVTHGSQSKSNILTFFIGFRTNLSAEKTENANQKVLQQAKLNQY